MGNNINNFQQPTFGLNIQEVIEGMTFTKNFRSATSEEWYVFFKELSEPTTGGAAATVIIHYELQGNRDVFMKTTIVVQDPILHEYESHPLLFAIIDEIINRLVGYSDTLLTVYAGENSYNAEYIR
ncbi:hypothetical protein CR203_24745 [Salipaludibacillus neizhouensis]|uniref:Uncharacterized protein n=1 Tax=Salipaludibacillus neizhouensis TaxID=885475 RepID=A0A3A9K0J2_9BACI|nr:hypothetical protein [Salipaludibacillus neizhouensis]RKL64728.1 hypothetical protein CR203_24745 [Salipaludibacillus neizhouensis]